MEHVDAPETSPPHHFDIWIRHDENTILSSNSGSISDGASNSGRSSGADDTAALRHTHNRFKFKRKQLQDIISSSIGLRELESEARRLGKHWLVLEEDLEIGVDSLALEFMVTNLPFDAKGFVANTPPVRLAALANAIWHFRCNPRRFLEGLNRLPDKYNPRMISRSGNSHSSRGVERSWRKQTWPTDTPTPLHLLIIAWVFSKDDDALNETFAEYIINAVWESDVVLKTAITEISDIERERRNQRRNVYESFRRATAPTNERSHNAKVNRIREEVGQRLGYDFSAGCVFAEGDTKATSNFRELSRHTPYEFLRSLENVLVGHPPNRSSRHQRTVSESLIGENHPRGPPEIDWRQFFVDVSGGVRNGLSPLHTAKCEILNAVAKSVQSNQQELVARWKKKRDEVQGSWMQTMGF